MLIEKMTPETAFKAALIEELCFPVPWSAQALIDECNNENTYFIVALNDGEVIGYGGMHTPSGDCFIDNIAVDPEHRRQGVGRSITAALIAEAKRIGGNFISLEVRPSNEAAVKLYRSLGFENVGFRKNFYMSPKEDALIMTRKEL